jgi:hypothetical protein
VTRRGAMKWLAGALLGGVLASLPFAREADAAPCPTGREKCFGTCCRSDQICNPGTKGAGASCVCPTGNIECNGACVTLGTAGNCAFCGNTCPTGMSCQNGQCVCDAGTLCGGQCVSTTCSGGREFNFATCSCACPSGTTECGDPATCVSTNCPGGQVLDQTTCQCACPSGSQLCQLTGNCVTPSCGNNSQFNPATCQCECLNGFTLCGGNCVTSCSGGQVLNAQCVCETPPPTGCQPTGGLCTSKNECCDLNAKCSRASSGPFAGRKVCTV